MGNLAVAQLAELVLRCAAERRCVEGDLLHCWVTRQDLATHMEETKGWPTGEKHEQNKDNKQQQTIKGPDNPTC